MLASAFAIEKPVAIGAFHCDRDHFVGRQDGDDVIARHGFRVAYEEESDLIARMENGLDLTTRGRPWEQLKEEDAATLNQVVGLPICRDELWRSSSRSSNHAPVNADDPSCFEFDILRLYVRLRDLIAPTLTTNAPHRHPQLDRSSTLSL